MAIAITIIPIPPIHCNNDLQSKIPLGKLSKPDITVDPVVVVPDIDSNKASVKDNFKSENIKGIEPKNEKKIQLNVVKRNACLIDKLKSSDLFAIINIIPTNRVIREAKIKGYQGDACSDCGNFTLTRNGTCLKCNTCGATSGCS